MLHFQSINMKRKQGKTGGKCAFECRYRKKKNFSSCSDRKFDEISAYPSTVMLFVGRCRIFNGSMPFHDLSVLCCRRCCCFFFFFRWFHVLLRIILIPWFEVYRLQYLAKIVVIICNEHLCPFGGVEYRRKIHVIQGSFHVTFIHFVLVWHCMTSCICACNADTFSLNDSLKGKIKITYSVRSGINRFFFCGN